jgi:hypothetical protein
VETGEVIERVVVMFDYSAYPPLWAEGQQPEPFHYCAHHLPIDGNLIDRLTAWTREGEAGYRGTHGDPPGPSQWPPSDGRTWREWNEAGHRLALEVRQQLSNEIEVLWFDETTRKRV